ncbi:MAG: TlpA family protein disulfide reductase [Cytophagaceae bacterium]|nr:TlpA family protein disulfide reductase [Cytophagaceae bacterium]
MVLLGEENLTVTADFSNLASTVVYKDSKENELHQQFRTFNDKHSTEINALNKKAQALNYEQYNNPEKYNTEIVKLQRSLDSLNTLQRKYYRDIISQNPNLFVSKYVSMFNFPDTLRKDNFFRAIDFTDAELTNGDMLTSKISYYYQRFVNPNLDDWKFAGVEVLKLAPAGTKNREVVYLTLIRLFLPYDDAYSKTLAKSYDQEYPNSVFPKKVLASLPKGAPGIGEAAPDITLTNPNGKQVSLSSYRGKVVLLDFWASWCGPCRGENPNVVRVYQKYKDKGFTVFSVSLDQAKDKWLAAIDADKLIWDSHVSDLKGWNSAAAKLYGVKGIPQTFLLDKDGKIIAMNLRGESLEAMLKNIFGE